MASRSKTREEIRQREEHAIKYFRRYIKQGKLIYVTVVRRTQKKEFLRFFVILNGSIQDITVSVQAIIGYPLVKQFNYSTLGHSTGMGGVHSVMLYLNQIVWGDEETTKYYKSEVI